MIAPIAGPVIGAYLTDNFNWRWVFYINVPVGMAALAGILLFMPDTVRRLRKFDFVGFGLLAIAVGALQIMLDRGSELDWFHSPEVLLELGIAIGAAWMFLVHTITHHEPFLDRRLFVDRNFTAALALIFVVGIVLLATMALLPPMLQNLMGYPIITVGLVLAPRGLGTMAAMMVVGRLVGKVDPRLLVGFGLSMTAFSLYQMTSFDIGMDYWPLVTSGVTQGFGLGFVFVPLSTVAFQTLAPQLRTEASGLFNLIRNIGSSIGISIMAALLTSNLQVNHADLAARINPFNQNLSTLGLSPALLASPAGAQTAAQLDGLVTQQALMIAYLDDFKAMFIITLCALPLLIMLRYRKLNPVTGSARKQEEQQPAMAMAE
jgi:DHA2 family multidrug resistance protein